MVCPTSIIVSTLVTVIISSIGVYIIKQSDPYQDFCWTSNYTFQCKSNSRCLTQWELCDGKFHCLDRSDEDADFCGDCKETPDFMYRCAINGNCITANQTCNQYEDCPDGSDEADFMCLLRDPKDPESAVSAFKTDENTTPKNQSDGGDPDSDYTQIDRMLELIRQRFYFQVEKVLAYSSSNCSTEHDNLRNVAPSKTFKGCIETKEDNKLRIECVGSSLKQIPWSIVDKCISNISISQGTLHTSKILPWKSDKHDRENSFGNVFQFTLESAMVNLTNADVTGNVIRGVANCAFCHLSKLLYLKLNNNSIQSLAVDSFSNTPLELLELSHNKIATLPPTFHNLTNLKLLFLDHNEIREIPGNFFKQLNSLWFLDLSHNQLKVISSGSFDNIPNLTYIILASNQLKQLSPRVFPRFNKIRFLNITDNQEFNNLEKSLVENHLSQLRTLDISSLDKERQIFQSNTTFDFIAEVCPNLSTIYFKKFSYCQSVRRQVRLCYPHTDGVSSLSKLLISPTDKVALLFGIVTVIGNMMVPLARFWKYYISTCPRTTAKITQTVDTFVCHLSLADFLMGIYLLTLVWQNSAMKDNMDNAYKWGTSSVCTGIGILAMVSSEVSMITLAIMSLERYLTIRRHFSREPLFSPMVAHVSMTIVWIFCIILAILPALQFENNAFYGSTSLCFPIHLSERKPVGWEYTTFIFVGINSACLCLITFSYSMLLYNVRKTSQSVSRPAVPAAYGKNVDLAKRLFLLVFTDGLCWAPIITMKVCVLCKYEWSEDTIAWAIVFVLPINSALNPFLYTFSTTEMQKAIFHQWNKVLTSNQRSSQPGQAIFHQGGYEEIGLQLLRMNGLVRSVVSRVPRGQAL